MEELDEDSILGIRCLADGSISYLENNGEEIAKLDVLSKSSNERDITLKLSTTVDSDIFSLTSLPRSKTEIKPEKFIERIIFSRFNSFLSQEDEGLYDAEILAYSKYILGIEKLPVISLSCEEVSPIATCDSDSQGLIDRKKLRYTVCDARNSKTSYEYSGREEINPDEIKLSNIFSKAYKLLYNDEDFDFSLEKSIVSPIVVIGDNHASIMLIEVKKQENGTIKYNWESCDSSGYHFDKFFKKYENVRSFYDRIDFQGNIGNCPIFALAALNEFKKQKFKTLEEAHKKRNMIMLSVASQVSQTLDRFYGIAKPGVREVKSDFKSSDLESGFCLIDYGKRKFVVNSNPLNDYSRGSILNDRRSRVIQLDNFLDKISKQLSGTRIEPTPTWTRKDRSGKTETISNPLDFFSLSKRGINSNLLGQTLGSVHTNSRIGGVKDNSILKYQSLIKQPKSQSLPIQKAEISHYWRDKFKKINQRQICLKRNIF